MTHSDNNGLVLPPDIAPFQIVILPIYKWNNQDKIKETVKEISSILWNKYRIEIDNRDYRSIWFKSYEREKKWVPLRIEIWSKDLETNNITIAIRYKLEKIKLNLSQNILVEINRIFEEIKKWMFLNANDYKNKLTFETDNYEEFIKNANKWFVKTYWCEWLSCENKIKDDFWITTRNIPFDQNHEPWKCIVCWKESKTKVFWAKSY
jgi:prolyl-tRNA synthetase